MMPAFPSRARCPPQDEDAKKQYGYFRSLLSGIVGLLASLAGLLVAVAYCSFCIVLSVVLWCRGIWRAFEWENEIAKQVGWGANSDSAVCLGVRHETHAA